MRCGPDRRHILAVGALAALLAWAPAAAQMPDVRAMAGLPIPSPELPDGTVTVRVVRGELSNNLENVDVELYGAGPVRTARTGADGRAAFANVPTGATISVRATVDGERLESSAFPVPARGGVRTLLAASVGAPGEAPGAPPAAQPIAPHPAVGSGPIVLGSNSRVAIELTDDVLRVFYLLDLVNRASQPVELAQPLVFEMPDGALNTTILEGSTRLAEARGSRVLVEGPLPPGVTPLQIAFRFEWPGDTLTLRQAFPVATEMMLMAVQKVGDMRLESPQLTQMRDGPIQNTTFIVASGPPLPAGTPFVATVTGLPSRARTGLWIALGLTGLIVGLAIWLAATPARGGAAAARRRALEAERDRGLGALAALEADRRVGQIDPREYDTRRAALMARLERIYGELDTGTDAPADEDAAA